MINFHKLNIDTCGRSAGKIKTYCPQCRDSRKNKRDKSLSVNIDTGLFHCHYCEWKGSAREKPETVKQAAYTPPPANHTQITVELVSWFANIRAIPQQVLTDMQITASHEFMPQTSAKEWCICFNYYEGERLVNTKFRDLHKHFKMTPGAELIPYNLNGIYQTPECIITEGEIDALSFIAAGRTDVISVPGGANRNLTWIDRFVESHFEDKQVIYIAVDSDRKGQELRQELIRRLGAERCRTVTFAEGCKDANEQLVKHGTESLIQALEDAPEVPLQGVFTAGDVCEELRTLYENGLESGADTGFANLDRLCTFELGRLCVLTGIPGCGKSEFIDELVVRLNLRHGWRTAFFSPENMPLPYHLRKLAEKLSGLKFRKPFFNEALYSRTTDWMTENITSILPEDNFTVDTILAKAQELVRRRGTRILIFDPLNRVEHLLPPGFTETQYLSALLDRMSNFARRNNCLVILVAHPTKMRREPGQLKEPVPTLYHINGSAAFYNKCDFGLVVERDREAGITRIHVEKVKFRHLGNVGTASFVYNPVNGRFAPCEEDANKQAVNTVFDNTDWSVEYKG